MDDGLSVEELANTNMCITKYLLTSLVPVEEATSKTISDYSSDTEIRTVVAI